MPKVALIESKPSYNNFNQLFEGKIDFDQYHLCSDASKKKVLKRDVDIDIHVDDYDYIILVGSDALKQYTSENSVTVYSGKMLNEKYLVCINPAMLTFKPEIRPLWERSRDSIVDYILGDKEDFVITDEMARGIQDTKEANAWIKEAIAWDCPYVAVDTETTGLYPRDGYIQGISLAYNDTHGVYIDSMCLDMESEELLQELFNKKSVIFHNSKFDLAMLEYHFNFKFPHFDDTLLLHYLIDENPGGHGLKQLALRYTKFGDYEKPLYTWMDAYRKANGILKGDFRWGDVPFEEMYTYAAMDALATFVLFEFFRDILKNPQLKSVYENILIPGTRFLTDVQDNGVPFDKIRLLEAQSLMQKEIDEAIQALYKHPEIAQFEESQGKGFNPNSVVQLRTLMFDFLGLKPTGKKTGTGKHSTDKDVLAELSLQHEVPELILAIRQKSKIKGTYLDKIFPNLDKDSRLRTGFNLFTTTSGRLSSSGKLNMQQLPRDNPIVKGCIQAAPGYKIVAMDLTTAEMYVAAVLSGDEALMDVFRSGGNFHNQIAHKVFKLNCDPEDVAKFHAHERQAAKAVSFGILYGAGARKISDEVTKESGKHFSVQEAQEVIDDYFRSFKKLHLWIQKNQIYIKLHGYIYSFFGRKRRLPNVASKDRGISGHSIRSGLNFLVQSVASDINLLGAIDTHAEIQTKGMESRIFALVHDSILAEVPDDEVDDYCKILLKHVQMDRGLSIPGTPVGCDFDIGQDYSFGKYGKKYGKARL